MDAAGGKPSNGGAEPDWGFVFARLSERFGWTPEQIGELTLPQVNAYMRYLQEMPWPYTVSVVPKEKGRRGR